ncbi:MAG: DNA polymerase III subunit gamma/tau [Polyangiaceae bacterium]|nr:DNA polymerase III subunit gamma/tau [Polyangiaceae bacterium]
MSYLVLARKYRPMTFADLIGQEHVSRVGKTTSARILAKSLNCAAGPTATPCLVCPQCLEIAASNDMDVQEIDGASYNGVDEVRKLQESLPYRPSRDRFKVVIVDEVHMLTQAAWNAFLKTLEEPPSHVKFIFATTEVHKVPVTILSRCQRYDFKLIPASAIAARLRDVLQRESIEADEAAFGLMSREAAGSMRDAMSLLDQAIAWGGDKLVGEQIAQVLGVAGRSTLHELASAVVLGDPQRCLQTVARLADQGFDLVHVAKDTLEHLRDLVVVKVCKDPAGLLELTREELQLASDLALATTQQDLLRVHLGFMRGFDQVVHAPQQRSALEMLLLRLATRPPLLPVDDLMARLHDLEKRLASRGAGSGAARQTAPRAVRADPTADVDGRSVPTARAAGNAAVAERAAPRLDADSSLRVVSDARPALPPPEPTPAPVPALLEPSVRPDPHRVPQPQRPSMLDRFATRPEPFSAVATPPEPRVLPHASEADLATWRTILDDVRARNVALASVLEHAVLLHVSPDALRLGMEEGSFYEQQAREESAVDLLTRVVRSQFGRATEVSFILRDATATAGRTLYDRDQQERERKRENERTAIEQHKLVRTAIEKLGARIHAIKLRDGE